MVNLPGTMLGLVEYGLRSANLLLEQDDALVELMGVLSRVERVVEPQNAAGAALLRDMERALRMSEGVRARVHPLIARME